MAAVDTYLGLITSAFANQPNFTAMITADVSIQVEIMNLFEEMIALEGLFDIDTAEGNELDIIGEWVGLPRDIEVPITGVFFSWDGTDPTLGWDYGIWQPAGQEFGIYSLPDDVYRKFLKAKIVANQWSGLTPDLYTFFDLAFPDLPILIQDFQNMSFGIIFLGLVDALTIALITEGYFPIKPEGVRLYGYFPPVPYNIPFGWDVETSTMQGWDEGAWYQVVETG